MEISDIEYESDEDDSTYDGISFGPPPINDSVQVMKKQKVSKRQLLHPFGKKFYIGFECANNFSRISSETECIHIFHTDCNLSLFNDFIICFGYKFAFVNYFKANHNIISMKITAYFKNLEKSQPHYRVQALTLDDVITLMRQYSRECPLYSDNSCEMELKIDAKCHPCESIYVHFTN